MSDKEVERQVRLRFEDVSFITRYLARDHGPKHQEWVGAPKIGKSTVLRLVKGHSFPTNYRVVLLDKLSGDAGYSWNFILNEILQADKSDSVAMLTDKYRDYTANYQQFFVELYGLSPQMIIVFLLDDFDKALAITRDSTTERGMLSPRWFLVLARQQNVRLVITTTNSLIREISGYEHLFSRPNWLMLPTGKAATEYVASSAVEKKHHAIVLEWAGYHPFLLSTFCDALIEDRNALNQWRHRQDVVNLLAENYAYLGLDKQVGASLRVVTKHLLTSKVEEIKESEHEKFQIDILRDRGIVDRDKSKLEIPSRLVREYLGTRLGLVSPLKKSWQWFCEFSGVRLFRMSYISFVFASGLGLVLSLCGKDPQWALLLTLVPILYTICGLLQYAWRTARMV